MSVSRVAGSNYVDCDYLFKIIIVGDSGVGKSSLLLRYADNVYNDNYISTIGVDFKIRTIDVDGSRVKLQMWDTAGQERFRNIVSSYFRSADAIVFAYDTTEIESFYNVEQWRKEIEKLSKANQSQILVGTKADLNWKKTVAYDEAKGYADAHQMSLLETSAKTNDNVTLTFETLASTLKQKTDGEMNLERQRGPTATLEDSVYFGNRRTTLLGPKDSNKKEVNCCVLS